MLPDPHGLYRETTGFLNGKKVAVGGDPVPFGRYPQEDENSKKDILWRVLEIRGGKALLFSEMILDSVPYNFSSENTCWKDCFLQKWLNSEASYKGDQGFLKEAFTEKEKEKICRTLVEPHENIDPDCRSDQGEAVINQIFLLSTEELVRYFASGESDTNYGIKGKELISSKTAYAKKRTREPAFAGWGGWWTRSVGGSGGLASVVSNFGGVNAVGFYVNDLNVGVRPALWVTLDS